MNQATSNQNPTAAPQSPLALVVVILIHLGAIMWLIQTAEPHAVHIKPPTSITASLIAPSSVIQPAQRTPKKTVQHNKPKHSTPTPTHTVATQQSTQQETSAPTTTHASATTSPHSPPTPEEASLPVRNEQPPLTTPPRTDASHHNNPAPNYPPMSRRLGEQGRVLLNVHIMPNGSVEQIKLHTSSGFPRLDEAAIATVAKWKYIPAKQGNEPIAFWYKQPISFVLNSN